VKKSFAPLMLTLSLSLIASCGKDGGSKSSSPNINSTVEEQTAEGTYRSVLRPMNNSLSGFLPNGFAEIRIEGDNAKIKTLLDDDARVTHMQSIHMGTRCPNASDDTNGDGVIDIEESYRASGDAFIPLDGDLNSAEKGAGNYPIGRGFTYLKSAELTSLQTDTRMRTQQNLNLGGRVILIHGVDASTSLPATVATREGMTAQASVPVVCGVIQRIHQ
jgi:hypothetical protein